MDSRRDARDIRRLLKPVDTSESPSAVFASAFGADAAAAAAASCSAAICAASCALLISRCAASSASRLRSFHWASAPMRANRLPLEYSAVVRRTYHRRGGGIYPA
eukprot:8356277-Pyramimonas_sp.AAC.2